MWDTIVAHLHETVPPVPWLASLDLIGPTMCETIVAHLTSLGLLESRLEPSATKVHNDAVFLVLLHEVYKRKRKRE